MKLMELMELMDGFDSTYRYVLVAARRARQLSTGAPPLVNTNAPHRLWQGQKPKADTSLSVLRFLRRFIFKFFRINSREFVLIRVYSRLAFKPQI